jgi:hypothetical protein
LEFVFYLSINQVLGVPICAQGRVV